MYLLGAIAPGERAVVERHLAACPACRAELADLAGLPALLRRVPGDDISDSLEATLVSPDPPDVMFSQLAALRHRRHVRAATAALVTGVAAASAVQALHVGASGSSGSAAARSVTVDASSSAGSVWAAVRYTAQPWGTELNVRITGVAPGTSCQLMVTGPGGHDLASGGWDIPAGKQVTWYPASVSWPVAEIRSFEVIAAGRVLVAVPVR